MNSVAGPEPSADRWEQVEPHLDQALDALGRMDRDAVVLRFLQRRDLRSVGQALGCSEDAAQKRVTRAVEKLRHFLGRRGITLSAAALSGLLGGPAAGAAPAGLAAIISTSAMASAAAAGAGAAGAGVASTLLHLMTTEKLTTVAVSTLLVAGLGTPLALQHQAKRNLEVENQALRQQGELVEQLRTENRRLAAVHVDPDEAERLRRENAEVHRLRGEVALLRSQQQDAERVAAENVELRRMITEIAKDVAAQQTRTPEQEREFENGINRLNLSKNWMLAIHLYAQEHEGLVPAAFADALPFFRPDDVIEGLSADDLEIVYAGKLDEIQDWARTIVVREREPQLSLEGKWTRAYGFADGHSEIRAQPTDDFTAWEQERMVGTALQ
jgi:hypothetical protein